MNYAQKSLHVPFCQYMKAFYQLSPVRMALKQRDELF